MAPPEAAERLDGWKQIARQPGKGVLLAIAVGAAAWSGCRSNDGPRLAAAGALAGPPVRWQLAGGTLSVRDTAGRLVFAHPFGLAVGSTRSEDDFTLSQPPVQFLDTDGDGRPEVLVTLPARQRADRRFYCFEATGRLRFTLQPEGSARFGSTDYSGPWLASHAWVTRRTDGGPSFWVAFVHGFLFPTRVLELEPHGAVLGEYWSNGYVVTVDEGRLGGRDVVVLGGVNNESRGASLAVVERDLFGGRAPAANAEYACTTCTGRAPRDFLVFPRSCLLQDAGSMAVVRAVSFEPGERLSVRVEQGRGRPDDPGASSPVYVRYTLGPDLALVDLEIGPELIALHDALAAAGRIDHRFAKDDERALRAVMRFAGSRFTRLPLPTARRQAPGRPRPM